ncbi:MAG: glycoside hydrolase family 97 N-terminal domain-containing protein, partial [Bacteroidaceae bacterium]|nr:glycoside hydrolase family 97 N-terminal domain-containing protein [Bacteroidaceae bacterium]
MRSTIALLLSILPCTVSSALAEEVTVSSPDGKLTVIVTDADATPTYSVTYEGQTVITPSPLGIHTDLHQLYTDMSLTETKTATVTDDYTLDRCKTSSVHYEANQLLATFTNTNAPAPATGNRRPNGPRSNSGAFTIEFQVSNNNIAFRYIIPEE